MSLPLLPAALGAGDKPWELMTCAFTSTAALFNLNSCQTGVCMMARPAPTLQTSSKVSRCPLGSRYPKSRSERGIGRGARRLEPLSQVRGVAPCRQRCLTLCDPMDCSLPGFSVYGIFHARKLELVAISSFRESSQPRI